MIDTPGIGENDVVNSLVYDCIKEFAVCACIYVIKSDNGIGVYSDRVSFINAVDGPRSAICFFVYQERDPQYSKI